ncbi:MAG: DUF1801 domain-containing protein [Erysipelotrichaceae bacterium]
MEAKVTYRSIDEYIALFPDDVQKLLKTIRQVIKEAAPDASEKIAYQMPTFYLYGNLVHFAAYKKHIGFYPTPSGIEPFMDELKGYTLTKGTIQFPLDKELPIDLIKRIVLLRVEQNTDWNKSKKK